ncbi:MAG: hypothetical protein MJY79_06765 [Bacteroidaceae bacterium]|nr:hypothetical protein [Bacteroidaceae bacterium]
MKNIASCIKTRIALSVLMLMAMLTASAQYKMVVHTNNGTSTEFWASSVDSVTWVYSEPESSGNDEDEATVTGDASNITVYTATISSWANILDNLSSDIKIGIIYTTTGTPSKSHGTQETVSLSSLDKNSQYSLTLNNLAPSTTYYYRSFVYQSGLWFYGKVKSFTTKNQGVDMVTGVASKITCYSAIVSGSISIDSSLDYRRLEYGICYSTSAEPTINDTRLQPESYAVRQNYTCQLCALAGNTIYYYRSYAYVDGYISYGPVQSFTTKEDNVVVTGSFNEEDCTVKSELKIGAGAYSSLKLGVCYGTTETPTVKDHTETANEVDDENNYIVTLNLTNVPVGTVYYRSYVKIDGVAHYGEVKSFVREYKVPAYEYVDLGLSVKWATFNVGATKPEEYGDYFAWGETEPKSDYSWSTYKYCSSYDSMTKYCTNSRSGYNGFTDNKTVLDLEDDAAHVNWGGNWRMPTKEEQDELRNNCTWTWTTLNGVNGYKVQSKKDGYTDKWIFLPAAGSRGDSDFYSVGSFGYFWSSSLYTDDPRYAFYLYFDSGGVWRSSDYRRHGQSVRPVCP